MVKIAVLASLNMDLVMRTERRPDTGETLQGEFAMHLGGKGFNQAVAARRLGAEVAVVGRVGDDDFGRRFLAALDREGIDRRCVGIDPATGTGVATITVDPQGGNSIVQAPRANRNLTQADVERSASVLAGADLALLQLETSMPAATSFAGMMRAAGVTTMLNPAPAMDVPPDLLALADILVPNEIEARALTAGRLRDSPPDADDVCSAAFRIADALRGDRGATVIITLGAAGAIAVAGNVRLRVPPFVVDVVDTVGAGDAFCAGFAVRTAEGADVATAVRFGSAAGALACSRQGAEPSMPLRREVEELLAKGISA